MAGFYEYTSPDEVKTTFFVSDFVADGVTKSFTLASIPQTVNNTNVYIDGVYQEKTGYSVLGNILTFLEAPPEFSRIEVNLMGVAEAQIGATSADLVSYVPESGGVTDVQTALRNVSASADLLLNQFVGDGTTQTFTLSSTAFENNTLVYFSGLYQSKNNYTVSENTPALITFSTAPPLNAAVEIMVSKASITQIGVPSDSTVTAAKIASNAVTTAKIADANVTTAKIQDSAVTTAKIADANVTTAKIADSNVTTAKIADANVTAAKIASVPITVGITSVVTATSLTATVNTHVYVSAATQTITLPASPAIGQRVLITVGNFADTVVARNGSNIMSSATDFTMDAAYLAIQFIYTDATQGWVMS